MARMAWIGLVLLLGACADKAETSPELEEMAHERGFNSFEDMARHDMARELDARGIEHDLERGGETYEQYDRRRDDYAGARGNFRGYECTEDCSGHEAGYEWASEHDIADPDECGGKSWSFIEGCRAYAEGE